MVSNASAVVDDATTEAVGGKARSGRGSGE